MTDTQLLTIKEVAKYLNVSTTIVYRLMKSGRLKFVLISGSRRITKDLLHEYLDTCLVDNSTQSKDIQ